MRPAVTQWFVDGEKPVNVGVYESGTRQGSDLCLIVGNCYQYWNGIYFGQVATTVEEAATWGHKKSVFQKEPWRGLAVKP